MVVRALEDGDQPLDQVEKALFGRRRVGDDVDERKQGVAARLTGAVRALQVAANHTEKRVDRWLCRPSLVR